jgi:hypothetical protein
MVNLSFFKLKYFYCLAALFPHHKLSSQIKFIQKWKKPLNSSDFQRQKFSETSRKENLEMLMDKDEDNVDGGNKLKEWMENCEKFVKIRPKNSEQCAGLMESLNVRKWHKIN